MNGLEIVATLVEAAEIRTFARERRDAGDRFWARHAYRFARNRLAALRRGEAEPSRWYVSVVTPGRTR